MGRKGCGQTIIRPATQQTTAFETMVAADVVVYASSQTRHFWNNQVALCRMQVAARRIAPQRPARLLVQLPGGEAEGQFEENADRFDTTCLRRNGPGAKKIAIGGSKLGAEEVQLDSRRPGVSAEGVRLRRPVEMPQGPRIPVQVVLGPLVIGQRPLNRRVRIHQT